jgi:DNA-binding response OmpR family regulator
MNLQALLITGDSSAADVLGRVLSGYGISTDWLSDSETAMARLLQQRFDALVVDFDALDAAKELLQRARKLGCEPLSIALVGDPTQVRGILDSGAHFILHKPVTEAAAQAGLRAAVALLRRERRRAFRVPVQAAVEITLPDQHKIDGILLDLSETGMDVLTPEEQAPGSLLAFHFRLPDDSIEVTANGQVAWANPNGQTGVQFLNLPDTLRDDLKQWLKSMATAAGAVPDESVPHCKLTDLSLGGCYLQTEAPFPENSLVDLCLKTAELEVHTEGMVRVVHPAEGMGVEFPSRTQEQRAKVLDLINSLRNSPGAMPELTISPRALVADRTQFETDSVNSEAAADEWEDPLLELLRRGTTLQPSDFHTELEQQRNPEDVASV